MSDLEFTMPTSNERRRAFRAKAYGISVAFEEKNVTCDILDVSVTGFAIKTESLFLKEGAEHSISIQVAGKAYLSDLTCRVVRILDNGIIGCDFRTLDRRQEARLDRLVLELQKRMIAKKKEKDAAK
ncbi:PilZ domain-containing protein [Halodesulfovibrio sp.]|jgi:c-di-GMP-binding flagellar brake protein YcgR|uniref:PilZ domain-containing protein n=1 Tax=Halodesulfovibrio sp. TaxID=1912772 RepID=UPI0025E60FE8|nr:PilZ domain-containing protein [Halodesulfovibrio sp.]MCT4536196.1 PilZ domain-containing protein [Halodesulfovibrio sp.]MCT4626840.1 PilZ domain-containing protein [Halodesulfovibrio sp.]